MLASFFGRLWVKTAEFAPFLFKYSFVKLDVNCDYLLNEWHNLDKYYNGLEDRGFQFDEFKYGEYMQEKHAVATCNSGTVSAYA
jgi:hypothetical protein